MEEKQRSQFCSQLPSDGHSEPQPVSLARRHSAPMSLRDRLPRRLFTVCFLTLIIWSLAHTLGYPYETSKPQDTSFINQEWAVDQSLIVADKNATRVPLEAHIMSKCPDAQACLQMLVLPTMEKIHEKVDFRLSFIGSIDPKSDAVSCMHGPPECLGNIIILCAEKLYPEPKLSLGFANCMISDYKEIPQRDLVEGCAMEHGLDFKKINGCISDEGEGASLLRDSAERSADHNVTKSCTVRLNGEIRCIRDGGKWYDCEGGSSVKNLTRDIEDLYDKLNP